MDREQVESVYSTVSGIQVAGLVCSQVHGLYPNESRVRRSDTYKWSSSSLNSEIKQYTLKCRYNAVFIAVIAVTAL